MCFQKKSLTVSQIVRILINTNAIRRLNANTSQIVQEHRRYLTFEAFLLKNRVWVSVYQGLSDFWTDFLCKKSLAQFAFGLGVSGATACLGRKWGLLPSTFPFGGNRNLPSIWLGNRGRSACQALSRLEGIETVLPKIDYGYNPQLAKHFPVWRESKLFLVTRMREY